MRLLSQMLGAVILFLVTPALGQKPVAELPRVYIDTTWNEPAHRYADVGFRCVGE